MASRHRASSHHAKGISQKTKAADVVKLLIAAALVVGGIWAFYALPGQPVYVRAALPVVGVALAVLIVFYWCDFGRRLVRYDRDSVAEFKNVVTPPRKDAMRMTMFVVAFVAVLALFIYAADSLISWLFYDVLLKRG